MDFTEIKTLALQMKMKLQLAINKLDQIIQLSDSQEVMEMDDINSVTKLEEVDSTSKTGNESEKKKSGNVEALQAKIKASAEDKNSDEYNKDWDFLRKIEHFAYKVHKRAFHQEEFLNFLKGKGEEEELQRATWSVKFGRLILTTDFIAAWYNNSRKNVAYLPAEWRTEDKLTIKSEYQPSDRVFGNMPEANRKKITFKGKKA